MNDSAPSAAIIIGSLVFMVLLVAFYFLPTIIAYKRKHASRMAICLVNVFFGWTALGWLLSLIWSLTSPGSGQQAVTVIVQNGNGNTHVADNRSNDRV